MKEFWNTIQLIFTAVGGWLGWFLGGCDGLLYALIAFVTIDYITGVMCAIADHTLSSEVGFKGIARKVLIFLLVGIGHIVDAQVIGSGGVMRTAVIFFYLSNEGVPTPAGKHQWGQTTIKSILSNEKYKGDALLQKTFCEDFLTKKMKTNQGEVPQYYVENNHEAIIDPETFEMVQRELARRTKGKNRHSGVHLLSGRIKCGDCGGWYGSKVWHSPEKCKRTVWQCNQKYKNEVRCTTPYLDEASVKERFTVAVNQLLAGRDAAITAYELGMVKTLDTTELEAQQQELLSEMEVLNGMIQQMIRQNAAVAQDQTEYNKRFDALGQKFKEAEAKKDAVAQQISDILDRRGTMEDFLRILKQQDGEVTAFSEKLWCGLLDYATAYADGRLTFTFKNGSTFEG